MFPRLIPVIIAFLILAAHFLRDGHLILTAASILVPGLLLLRKRWVLTLVQGLAYFGAAVWLYTASVLVQQRIMAGVPWVRMLIILFGVAVFTLFSGHLLTSESIKKHYL
jgi:hypothetical protein